MISDHGNTAEVRREAAQADLDARRSSTERNRLGQFATPNALALQIARFVQSLSGHSLRAIRFADPSIGTGRFYSAALTVFGKERSIGRWTSKLILPFARLLENFGVMLALKLSETTLLVLSPMARSYLRPI